MEKKRDQNGSIFRRIFTRFSIKFRIENLHHNLPSQFSFGWLITKVAHSTYVYILNCCYEY